MSGHTIEAVIVILVAIQWTLTALTVRWLLTGRRPRILIHATRASAYFGAASGVQTTFGAIVVFGLMHRWPLYHRIPPGYIWLSPFVLLAFSAIAVIPVWLADGAGRRRQRPSRG